MRKTVRVETISFPRNPRDTFYRFNKNLPQRFIYPIPLADNAI